MKFTYYAYQIRSRRICRTLAFSSLSLLKLVLLIMLKNEERKWWVVSLIIRHIVCLTPSGPTLRVVQIRSRRICRTLAFSSLRFT
ncbi:MULTISPECIES: hypothetical protein [unclassified Gilliamella]|uniref:hypothetical protein n=1 Tax=unclassified Gilliamella TaxID=2685620 RepID=UPI00226A398D|nr:MULTISPECIES: hypothetical protein [unclassified Gilliamella]MCX8587055.1 hypothetical protein [Gilliamella sp. B3801]MCX8592273.1 hypothetical protein [Gilliamella sp. B3804]